MCPWIPITRIYPPLCWSTSPCQPPGSGSGNLKGKRAYKPSLYWYNLRQRKQLWRPLGLSTWSWSHCRTWVNLRLHHIYHIYIYINKYITTHLKLKTTGNFGRHFCSCGKAISQSENWEGVHKSLLLSFSWNMNSLPHLKVHPRWKVRFYYHPTTRK